MVCSSVDATRRTHARIAVRGAVQGVGFRPFVFRLANELALAGWVQNSRAGVAIEVEGAPASVDEFVTRLETDKPPYATIRDCAVSFAAATGLEDFAIRECDDHGAPTATILPDLATCPECQRELFDPANRRHRYPFTNCTHCGPRFSIVESLPYDRPNTAMKAFRLCAACDAEYRDPANRRFHAQPNACPCCGPQLALWDAGGITLAQRDEALWAAAGHLRDGAIVALKGVGGFQLLADARNESAVRALRRRKHRAAKPFAVMFPDLESVRDACIVSDLEAGWLMSAAAPIVLLRGRSRDETPPVVAAAVAPGNPQVGVLLPYSPLHHLLLADLGFPVVATSGNISDEPICTDEREALARLRGVADFFLVHDRPIVRPIDDSVVRELLGGEQVLRRARGYAPLPVSVDAELPPVLAVGAHLKNTVALSVGREVFLSSHLGDLESPQARAAFQRATADLPRLYATTPALVACDLHPGYVSTHFARATPRNVAGVQHHYAHILACMAEHQLDAPVLGVCWDGTGYGPDGTIWGGEFLRIDETGFERFGRFRPFPLAGGDAAAREPRRCALGVLHELCGEEAFLRPDLAPLRAFAPTALRVLRRMFALGINVVPTSSAGRLFDAVASLAGLRHQSTFEGQAAMELEFAIAPGWHAPYPFEIRQEEIAEFDWAPTIEAIIDDLDAGEPAGRVAARFHQTLIEVIAAMAARAGVPDVVLTGGCFQNAWLAAQAAQRLRAEGFTPHWPQQVPPNDGGIALGQILAAARALRHRPGEMTKECVA